MEDEDLKNFVGTLAKRLHGRFDAMRKDGGVVDEMGSRIEAVLREPEAERCPAQSKRRARQQSKCSCKDMEFQCYDQVDEHPQHVFSSSGVSSLVSA